MERERIEARFRADLQRWSISIVSDEACSTIETLPVSAGRAQAISRACDVGRRNRLPVYAPNAHEAKMECFLRRPTR